MQHNHVQAVQIKPFPKYLWFLILSYAMVYSMCNWFDARLIMLFGFPISPGAILFPITFLVSDVITEVYGFKHARIAIWSALLFNILFVGFGQIILHLPSPAFAKQNNAFNKVLQLDTFVIIGSFVCYLVSEPLNSLLISKMKIYFKGQYMGLRFVLSTFAASFFDSFIFALIAFSAFYSIQHVLTIGLNIWLIKMIIEILGLPISVRIAKILKKKEHIDIYDVGTSYNLFKLDTSYPSPNNKPQLNDQKSSKEL